MKVAWYSCGVSSFIAAYLAKVYYSRNGSDPQYESVISPANSAAFQERIPHMAFGPP